MPTGYTTVIEEKPDLTFREFALRCARGFGACVLQRDEDINTPPRIDPLESPTSYEKMKLQEEGRLRELRSLSPEGAQALFDAAVARAVKFNEESSVRCATLKGRYDRMLAMVEAWVPPTPDHENLRKFMLEQIDACKWDWTPFPVDVPTDRAEWLSKEIARNEENVVYYAKKHEEELARHASRKAWVERLYASLGGQP